MKTVHALITGRVQGVSYRAWTADEAEARGIAGWVRNRRDGTVEAVFSGEDEAVEAMLAACREGPRTAVVNQVEVTQAEAPGHRGFRILPTVEGD